MSRETAAFYADVLGTSYNYALVYNVFRSHTPKVHVFLSVTCHMHFRHNDGHLLRTTAVERMPNTEVVHAKVAIFSDAFSVLQALPDPRNRHPGDLATAFCPEDSHPADTLAL